MSATRILLIGLGGVAAAATIYSLTLLRSPPAPAPPPAPVEPAPPAASEPPPQLPPPPAPAPAPTAAPIVHTTPPAAPSGPRPGSSMSGARSVEELHITDAEQAAIAPVMKAAQERVQNLVTDFKARHPVIEKTPAAAELAERIKQVEADTVDELSRTLGPERAKEYVTLTRGYMPGVGRKPEPPTP